MDVAEDLAGKFVPTFVRPEHTQPERGSFFVTGGRIFPAGTIDGDGATFDPNRSGHIGIWICRGTHLVAANEIPAAPLWVSTAQLFVEQLLKGAGRQVEAVNVDGLGRGDRPDRGVHRVRLAVATPEHPLEHAQFSPKPGQRKPPRRPCGTS